MTPALWDRYREFLVVHPSIKLRLDPSRMKFTGEFLAKMEPRDAAGLRRDGRARRRRHRQPRREAHGRPLLAARLPSSRPTPDLRSEIDDTLARIKTFADDVHDGAHRAASAARFKNVLVIGIGGSALGPAVRRRGARRGRATACAPFFFDNTDPDGIDRVLDAHRRRASTRR